MKDYRELLMRTAKAPQVASVQDPTSVGSDWGNSSRPFRELVGSSLTLDTSDVLIDSELRPVNADYAIFSSLWIILGKDELEPLNAYNSRGAAFSADGYTLSGAFGKRLRGLEVDQLESITQLLQVDPASRRAIALIGRPGDLQSQSKDFPCATSVQFLLREERLSAVVVMRSQSLFGVFPYDVVNFRYLQEYMAWRLRVPIGRLTFLFGSLHIYDEELSRVERFLSAEATVKPLPRLPWAELEAKYEEWSQGSFGRLRLREFLGQSEPQAAVDV